MQREKSVISKHKSTLIDSYPLGQNGRRFVEYIFKYIFMNDKFCLLIQIWLMFVSKGLIYIGPGNEWLDGD